MNEIQKHTLKSRVDGIENAWILVSGRMRESVTGDIRARATISFLYDSGEWAAEWEPEYGPIQAWHKCMANVPNAKEHYYYDFVDNDPLNWSQLAVDHEGLPAAFIDGNYLHIFYVLKKWAASPAATEPDEERRKRCSQTSN